MSPSPSDDLPVPNPVQSFWTNPPDPLDNYRSTPTLPSTCDILIIGSGYAGVSTAYHIFNHPRFQPDPTNANAKPHALPSTIILEARSITSGATGRNGGHIKPDTYAGITRYASLYGWEQAAALQKFESEQVWLVKQMLEKEGLQDECEFHLTRAVDAIMDEELAQVRLREYRAMVQQGLVDVRDVAYTGGKHAERISGVKGVKACFSFTAAHMWPKKMVQGLLRKLLDRGLKVYSHTPVLNISATTPPSIDDYKWTVTTTNGTIKAKKVVVCTNAYTSSVLPQYKNKIIPVRGVCCHIASTKGVETPHLPSTYSLRFDAQQYDYLIPRQDGSIIVGGARAAFWHDKESWWDNKDDNELVRGGKEYFDGYMQRYFHGWEDSGAEVAKIWTGIMGYSSDLVPHLGAVPGDAAAAAAAGGQYILAGFSGHGMPQIFGASKGVARMVVENIGYEATGLPALFQTSIARLQEERNWMEEGLRVVWEGKDGKLSSSSSSSSSRL